MKTQILELIKSMEAEIKSLEEKWDKLDSQARVEDQRKLVNKMVTLQNEIDGLKNLIKIMEG